MIYVRGIRRAERFRARNWDNAFIGIPRRRKTKRKAYGKVVGLFLENIYVVFAEKILVYPFEQVFLRFHAMRKSEIVIYHKCNTKYNYLCCIVYMIAKHKCE